MYMHLMYLVTSIGCSLHIVHDLISPLGMAIRYGLTVASLVEPTTYREATIHPDWQHAMSEEIAALERTGTWDLVPFPPHATPITCESIRLRLDLMALLSATRLALWHVVFSRSMVVTMIRLLLLLLT